MAARGRQRGALPPAGGWTRDVGWRMVWRPTCGVSRRLPELAPRRFLTASSGLGNELSGARTQRYLLLRGFKNQFTSRLNRLEVTEWCER